MILVMDWLLTGQSISVNRFQLTENYVSIWKILNIGRKIAKVNFILKFVFNPLFNWKFQTKKTEFDYITDPSLDHIQTQFHDKVFFSKNFIAEILFNVINREKHL